MDLISAKGLEKCESVDKYPEGEDNNLDKGMTEKLPNKFGPSEVFRLRHRLIMIIEEIKLRKECEDRNDAKIKELLSQVYQLEKTKDSLEHQLKQEEARFKTAMAQMKQVRENQENQASKHQHPTSSKDDKSTDILKEEARKLQLVNFQQEKTIQSLEAKFQSQTNSTNQAMEQLSNLEDKLSTITRLYQETNAYLGRLEDTGKSLCQR